MALRSAGLAKGLIVEAFTSGQRVLTEIAVAGFGNSLLAEEMWIRKKRKQTVYGAPEVNRLTLLKIGRTILDLDDDTFARMPSSGWNSA